MLATFPSLAGNNCCCCCFQNSWETKGWRKSPY